MAALLALPAASAPAATTPAIVFQQGRECPAHMDCTGDTHFNSRIYAIERIGGPSRALTTPVTLIMTSRSVP